MQEKMIRSSVDFSKPIVFSSEEREALARLEKTEDDPIDFSDIPEASGEGWKRVEPGRFTGALTPIEPIHIEADILTWFQNHTPDYNLRINEILRKEISSIEAQPELKKTA